MTDQQNNHNSSSTPDINTKLQMKFPIHNRILYSSQKRRENSFGGMKKQNYLQQYSCEAIRRYDDKKHQWKEIRSKIRSFKLDTNYSPGHQPGHKINLPLFNDVKNGVNDSVEDLQISKAQSKQNGQFDMNFKKIIEKLNRSRKFSKKTNSFVSSPFPNNNTNLFDKNSSSLKNPNKIYKSKMFELNYNDTPQPILEPAGPIEDLLNHPEEMTNRIILERKTKVQMNVFYAMQLSLAYERLIIIVNKMGDKSKRFSMIINKHHSQMLLRVFSQRIQQILQNVIIGTQGISLKKSLLTDIPVQFDILQSQKKYKQKIKSSQSRKRKIYSSNSQRISFQKRKDDVIFNKLALPENLHQQTKPTLKINSFEKNQQTVKHQPRKNNLQIQIQQIDQNNSLMISETINKNSLIGQQNPSKVSNKNLKESVVGQQIMKNPSEMINQSIGIQISQVCDSQAN